MKEEEKLDQDLSRFARRAGELLQRSANELPAGIRSRLTSARYAALAQSRARSSYGAPMWRRWLPVGAAAAAVLAVLLLQGPRLGSGAPQAGSGGSEDFEMLADSSAFALAQDQLGQGGEVDYEFYDWAVYAADDEHGGEAGS
jgi:Protein of unknown function (DUF3619)